MTKTKEEKKMFVLDTNVLIMDPLAFRQMGDHDVVIPLVVITEVDKLKSKPTPAAVSARQVSANLDAYFCPDLYKDGVSLGEGKGKLSIYNLKKLHPEVQAMFVEDSPDNRIISVALYLTEKMKKAKKGKNADDSKVSVVFVTNDINLRFKAGALGINVEKYRNNTFQDVDSIYSGVKNITLSKELERKFKRSGGRLDYSLFEKNITAETNPNPYEFFLLHARNEKIYMTYYLDGSLYEVVDSDKIYNTVVVRNDEQMLGMNILLNPDVTLVTLSGPAGTGKTLLAIGAALRQQKKYKQILIAKPIVALSGKETGYLPGNAVDKTRPYMKSLYDNIDFLKASFKDPENNEITTLLKSGKVVVEPLDYIRGRTYANTILVVDEAQNLAPAEVKTIVTRMGKNSKVIFTGDIYQIDNKYLDSSNNGLTNLIEKSKRYRHSAHINLVKGERSDLAEWGGLYLWFCKNSPCNMESFIKNKKDNKIYFFNPSSIVNRFENMLATVSGQTPPGTGVISFTKSFTLSKSISQTAFQSLYQYHTSTNTWLLSSRIKSLFTKWIAHVHETI